MASWRKKRRVPSCRPSSPSNNRSRGRGPFTLITVLRVQYFLIKIIILVTSRCHVKKPRCLSLLKDEAYARAVSFPRQGYCQVCLFERNFTRGWSRWLVVLFTSLLSSPSSPIPKAERRKRTAKEPRTGLLHRWKKVAKGESILSLSLYTLSPRQDERYVVLSRVWWFGESFSASGYRRPTKARIFA